MKNPRILRTKLLKMGIFWQKHRNDRAAALGVVAVIARAPYGKIESFIVSIVPPGRNIGADNFYVINLLLELTAQGNSFRAMSFTKLRRAMQVAVKLARLRDIGIVIQERPRIVAPRVA